MALKLFILGLPGSGKSTIAHCVMAYLKDRSWGGIHFSDHIILREMYLADTEHKWFEPTDHGGFDVHELTVLYAALKELEQIINEYLVSANQKEVVLIEFARNDYQRAFRQFSNVFLHDAYFLYLDVETDVCKRRIQERIANRSSEDDFYVSEYIFSTYYNKDDGRAIQHILASDHGIEKESVIVIDNNRSHSGSIEEVYQFVDTMCGLGPVQDS